MSEYDPTRLEENRARIAAFRNEIANDQPEVLAEHGSAPNLSRTVDGREWHSVGAWLMPGERIVVQRASELASLRAPCEGVESQVVVQDNGGFEYVPADFARNLAAQLREAQADLFAYKTMFHDTKRRAELAEQRLHDCEVRWLQSQAKQEDAEKQLAEAQATVAEQFAQLHFLENELTEAVAREREACAKVCGQLFLADDHYAFENGFNVALRKCAEAIRNRGEGEKNG